MGSIPISGQRCCHPTAVHLQRRAISTPSPPPGRCSYRTSYKSLCQRRSLTSFCLQAQQKASSVAVHENLLEYVLKGPLLPLCGISEKDVKSQFDDWARLGDFICAFLKFRPQSSLNDVERMRVYQYYLPIYFWMREQLERHKASTNGQQRPLTIGMQAPQGCGKTTIVEVLEAVFKHEGMRPASISIDDFYLRFEDQQALAQAKSDNKLLQVRGNAGTHDLQLGQETLEALQSAVSAEAETAVPRYDKSKNEGRGDRAERSSWPHVQGPVDIILFEGWMLGFSPVEEAEVAKVSTDLVSINEKLRDYEAAWDAHVDAWLVVKVGTPEWVHRWRLQAEHAMRDSGKPGMTDEQVAKFVDCYMPAYKAYLPGLYTKGPTTAKAGRLLMLEIDENRGLVSEQPACPL